MSSGALAQRSVELLRALEHTGGNAAVIRSNRDSLINFLDNRRQRLQGLIELLVPASPSPCHHSWLSETKSAMALAEALPVGSGSDRIFLGRVGEEERRFFFNLHFSQVPVLRDQLIGQLDALRRAISVFGAGWEECLRLDPSLPRKMRRRAAEYRVLERAAATKVAREAARERGLAETEVSGIAGFILTLGRGRMGEVAFGSAVDVEERSVDYFQLLSREESIIPMFAEARDAIRVFLLDNSYPMLKAALAEGEAAADVLPTKMPTPGQVADGRELAWMVKERLGAIARMADAEYAEFVRRHAAILFGPLTTGAHRQAIARDRTEHDTPCRVTACRNPDAELRDRFVLAAPDRALEISLDGMTEPERDRIFDSLCRSNRRMFRSWSALQEPCGTLAWDRSPHAAR